MPITLIEAVAQFGREAGVRLRNPSVMGEPEDQLRGPFEQLLTQLSQLCGHKPGQVTAVGETTIAALRTRPDYAVTVGGALVGFIEIKAPGKGADPRRFKGHDKTQWQRLQSLPNLIYTDGNAFSLWRNGELALEIEHLDGDIETSGDALGPSAGLLGLFDHFLQWDPQPPTSAKELAEIGARLCRLLRDEVTEALANRESALTELATDWRHLLFPDASDAQFADGYAQAVTFGLLMARAYDIPIGNDMHQVSVALRRTSSLIATALQLLTDNPDTRAVLHTSLGTLERVLGAVDWKRISRGRTDAWLYFYEDFLEVYDNKLRKATGSYYTPPEVVAAMVGLVDEALRRPGFARPRGLASPEVVVADPAVGTGTFMLGVLRHVAKAVAADEGPGAVSGAVQATLARLIGFELQLGPFAVAQLRMLAEVRSLTGAMPTQPARMFVTDTLADPHDQGGQFASVFGPIAKQREAANRLKREQPITVVIGKPCALSVVTTNLRLPLARMPWRCINRRTRSLPTRRPRASSSRCMRGQPYSPRNCSWMARMWISKASSLCRPRGPCSVPRVDASQRKYPLALTCKTSHISVIGQRPFIEKIQAYFAARPAQSTPRLFLRCRAPSSTGPPAPSTARSPPARA